MIIKLGLVYISHLIDTNFFSPMSYEFSLFLSSFLNCSVFFQQVLNIHSVTSSYLGFSHEKDKIPFPENLTF